MGIRAEGVEKATADYREIDRQIMATKLYVQNKILGIEDADMVAVITAGEGYLAEVRSRFLDDPILMAGYMLNRTSQREREDAEWYRLLLQLEGHLQIQPLSGLSYGQRDLHP